MVAQTFTVLMFTAAGSAANPGDPLSSSDCRYQQEERDRFGEAFGDARSHRRPEVLRRMD